MLSKMTSNPAPTIAICGLSEAAKRIVEFEPSAVISLVDPGVAIERVGDRHLVLFFEDVESRSANFPPRVEHVQSIIEFAAKLTPADRVLIHCHGGVSRSSAAAMIIRAVFTNGVRGDWTDYSPGLIAEWLLSIRTIAWPNTLMLRHAEHLLGVEHRLFTNVADILSVGWADRWEDWKEGNP
jgi:predicted protein tyrosine phosphatase